MIKLHLFLDIINLIFPKTCYSCKSVLVKNERVLCLKCYVDLPKHFNRQNIHQLILSVNGKNYIEGTNSKKECHTITDLRIKV